MNTQFLLASSVFDTTTGQWVVTAPPPFQQIKPVKTVSEPGTVIALFLTIAVCLIQKQLKS